MSQVGAQAKTAIVTIHIRQLVSIVMVGAFVGGVVWGLTLLLEAYVFRSALCHGETCMSSLGYSGAFGTIITAIIGTAWLIRLHVYRALLIGLAAGCSLWGLTIVLQAMSWQGALLASVLLYAVAYGLFAWVSRIKAFTLVSIIMLVVIVATRLMLVA